MQCPRCGFENPEGLKFCNGCGTPLSGHCAECRFTNQPGSRFCGECGISLGASTLAPQATKPDAEGRFHALLPDVIARLQRDRRVTYLTLKYVFGIDDAFLNDLRKELAFKRLAIDEDGEGLVWTGEAQPISQPTATLLSHPVTAAPTPSLETESLTPSNGPTIPDDAVTSEPARLIPEAEHRQLTVMFCDLADSTKLS